MAQTLRRCFLILFVILFSFPMPGPAQTPVPGTSGNKAANVLKLDGGVPYFKTWLEQDAIWIITHGERVAFRTLKSDEERELFVETFWLRRDPTPETYENEYKEEHYRRIVYANQHFGSSVAGWKSDRGRFYIMLGPPDEIESYAAKAEDKGSAADPSSYPLDVWHYRYLEGIGRDAVLEFVDTCKCGDYRMPIKLVREEDARSFAPEGLASRQRGSPEPADSKAFVGPFSTQKVRSKDLEEKAIVDLPWKHLPFEVEIGTVKATDVTSVVPITIVFQRRDLVFADKGQLRPATLTIFGRITTLTGRVAETFETSLTIDPSGPESDSSKPAAAAVEMLALRNGRYRVEIAAQEAGTDLWGRWVQGVKVGDE